MKVRSFSHAGITVSDFNKAVTFYWEIFGCPLVGVADTPPDRVRSFFGVGDDAESRCKIRVRRRRAGDLRVPAAAASGALEWSRPDAHLVQRAKPAAVARLPDAERRRVRVAPGAITARTFVLLRKTSTAT